MPDTENGAESEDFVLRSREFVEWFRTAEGTRLSDRIELADLRSRGAGRGVLATQDIAEDEELFVIPRKLVLTTTTSKYIPASALPEPGSWLPLIIVVVHELLQKEHSPWYHYFRALPSSFDTLMFWNEAELAELQVSSVLQKIGKAKAEEDFRQKAWNFMMADLEFFDVDGDDKDEWEEHAVRLCHYAGSLIMAYAFDIDRDDEENEKDQTIVDRDELQSDDEDEPLKGLVPFADMLNADADRNNARLFQEDNYLVMKAIKPIKAGEEIFNDYGPLPRSELLRMYGYVADNYKQYDVVDFEHKLLKDVAGDRVKSAAYQKRMEQLDELGVLDDGYSFPRSAPDEKLESAIPGELHMILRGLCLDGSKLSKSKDPLSIEEAALLSSAATKKLSEYQTTLENDISTLQTLQQGAESVVPKSISKNRFYMALQVRSGEKEILYDIIRLCQQYVTDQTNDKKRKQQNGEAASSKAGKSKKTKT